MNEDEKNVRPYAVEASAEPTSTAVVVKTEWEELDCILTDDEQRDRGRQLADALADVAQFHAEQKSAKETAKDRLETLQGECNRLARIVRAGHETRPVRVQIVHDDRRLMVDKVRLDTGETFASRTMTESEKQRALPFVKPAATQVN